ncbi:hypothetical protein H8356DRAFT_1397070 [Neocallimastix lanati (nom. inval.)]|nr:hypothetical protein H8356DRAFT_1397070 [Neocallimastix sp. JGI-2020a]
MLKFGNLELIIDLGEKEFYIIAAVVDDIIKLLRKEQIRFNKISTLNECVALIRKTLRQLKKIITKPNETVFDFNTRYLEPYDQLEINDKIPDLRMSSNAFNLAEKYERILNDFMEAPRNSNARNRYNNNIYNDRGYRVQRYIKTSYNPPFNNNNYNNYNDFVPQNNTKKIQSCTVSLLVGYQNRINNPNNYKNFNNSYTNNNNNNYFQRPKDDNNNNSNNNNNIEGEIDLKLIVSVNSLELLLQKEVEMIRIDNDNNSDNYHDNNVSFDVEKNTLNRRVLRLRIRSRSKINNSANNRNNTNNNDHNANDTDNKNINSSSNNNYNNNYTDYNNSCDKINNDDCIISNNIIKNIINNEENGTRNLQFEIVNNPYHSYVSKEIKEQDIAVVRESVKGSTSVILIDGCKIVGKVYQTMSDAEECVYEIVPLEMTIGNLKI